MRRRGSSPSRHLVHHALVASFEQRQTSVRAIVSLPGGERVSARFPSLRAAKRWADQQEKLKRQGLLRPRAPKPTSVAQISQLDRHTLARIKSAGGFSDENLPTAHGARVVAALLLCVQTGMSANESLRLRTDDVDLPANTLSVSGRTIPLTRRGGQLARGLLASIPANQHSTKELPNPPYVIGLSFGVRERVWRSIREAADDPKLAHLDLQHEGALRLARIATSPASLALMLGLKDVARLQATYFANAA